MSGTSKWTTWVGPLWIGMFGHGVHDPGPFLAKATPVMSNYVPVLDGSFF